MTIMFITADIGGIHQLSHKLPILPIHDILKKQGYDVIWGTWNPWGVPFKQEDKEKTIDFYVTGDTGIPGGERKLQTKTFFHTHGLHKIEKGHMPHKEWYGCLMPGEYWYNTYNDRAEISYRREELTTFPLTGWAKLDVLFKNTKDETIAEYGLNLPYEKTVLYAPAGNWNYSTSFDKSIEHIIKLFSKLPYNLIIKNGLYSSSFKKWGWYKKEAVPPHINKVQGAPLSSANIDITPLYNVADAMITDGTSVAWEFIGTDKPVVQLTNMKDPIISLMEGPCKHRCSIEKEKGYRYKNVTGGSVIINDHDECRACGGAIKTTLEDLERTIIEAIENPELYQVERRKWSILYNKYVDGKCAQRCVDAIKRIAEI